MKEQEENLPVFKKFSLNTRKILISAQKIAQNINSNLGSEHILLALAITPGTLVHSIMQENMISLDQIRLVISLTADRTNPSKQGLSEEAKTIIKKAAILAKQFQHHQIDPEHLLLAIVSSQDSIAYQIILRIGADPEEIKLQINDLFEDIRELEQRSFNLPQFNFEDFSAR
jgi:ATP-dependent Clp protease ATP-binding subunit ClpC